MKYGELGLEKLTPEQLGCTLSFYDKEEDEWYPVNCLVDWRNDSLQLTFCEDEEECPTYGDIKEILSPKQFDQDIFIEDVLVTALEFTEEADVLDKDNPYLC